MTLTAIRRATVNSTDRRHAQEEVVMTTTQDLPRAFARLARCGSHRVVVLVAGLARRGVGALRRLLLVMLLKRPVVVGLALAGIGSRAELRDRDARRLHERTIFDVGNDLSGFGRQIDSKAVARKPTDQVAAKRSVVVRGAFGHAIPEAPRIAKDNDLRCLPSRRPGHRCDAAVIVGTCLVENANIARIDEIGELTSSGGFAESKQRAPTSFESALSGSSDAGARSATAPAIRREKPVAAGRQIPGRPRLQREASWQQNFGQSVGSRLGAYVPPPFRPATMG